MIKVFIAKNPTEAHLVEGLMRSQGIEAEVRGEALFAVNGAPAIASMRPSVWVPGPREQVEQAEKILARYHGGSVPMPGSGWTCPECGEAHEAQFTDCWHCGSAQPAQGGPAPS